MKKILMLGTAFVMLGAATDAHAQDRLYSSKDSDRVLSDTRYQQRAPVVEQRTTAEQAAVIEPAAGDPYANFTGPYIGAQGGYTIGSGEAQGIAGVPNGDVGLDGFNYGVFAGFGFAQNFTRLLGGYAGIEVGYDWSEADGSYAGTGFEKESEILVTFRPGVTFNEDVLGYGIIGWSRAEFEGGGDDDNVNGLVLGAGTELGFNMPLRLRTELTYTNYETADIGATDLDPHDLGIKVGALFRF